MALDIVGNSRMPDRFPAAIEAGTNLALGVRVPFMRLRTARTRTGARIYYGAWLVRRVRLGSTACRRVVAVASRTGRQTDGPRRRPQPKPQPSRCMHALSL